METGSIEIIIDKYQFPIYKYCYQMVRNKETAEDLTQEIFIKFYQLCTKKYYNTNYLYSIAHSKCIDQLRKQRREILFNKNLLHADNYEISTEDKYLNNQYSYELESILKKLSNYERSVLLLKTVNGLSFNEISMILNKKETTVRKQFQRVKSKLEKELNKKGVNKIEEKVSFYG